MVEIKIRVTRDTLDRLDRTAADRVRSRASQGGLLVKAALDAIGKRTRSGQPAEEIV
jgi:hypothetical protein